VAAPRCGKTGRALGAELKPVHFAKIAAIGDPIAAGEFIGMSQRCDSGRAPDLSPLNPWSDSAKSPCRGFAARILDPGSAQRWSRFLLPANLMIPNLPPGRHIRLERGDITGLAVDAIVNAANTALLGGGGVDGAIHRAAGPGLLAECRTIGGCPPGEARLTRGYRLPAGHVIHTVGPVWQGGERGERDVLASCYRACLAIAQDRRFRAIAFPAIATGVYGFPREAAARIAVAAVRAHLGANEMPERVILMCFDEATLGAYRLALGLAAG
jgi:O-acetyl-ADP-ribose deacetylase (regulator of RNase III)